ncbi:7263_t:CDS:1, partial [Paraglomus occultum]
GELTDENNNLSDFDVQDENNSISQIVEKFETNLQRAMNTNG